MAEKPKDFNLSDESIEILASKIHQLEFDDLPYKLQVYSCRQCNIVAIKHHIANCQHVFCHECYAIYYGRQCPVCETVITGSTLDDMFMKTVLNFKVSCEFKKNGCQTVVELGDFLGHIEVCRLATKRLLPKLYKADPLAEAIERINANLQEMKNMMQGLQTEITQMKGDMQEMKNENAKQMTTMTKGMRKQEEETVTMKETITEIEKKFHDKLAACAANEKQLATITKIQQDEIVKMKATIAANEKKVQDNLTKETKKLEGEIEKIKKAIAEMERKIQDKPRDNLSVNEQLLTNVTKTVTTGTEKQEEIVEMDTIIALEKKSQEKNLDNISACGTNNEILSNVTTATEKEDGVVEMNKTITATEKKIQDNVNDCAANTEQLTEDLQSQIDLVEIRATELLKHNPSHGLGETLPRDLNAEVSSSDSLDTSFDWTISGVIKKLGKCKKSGDEFAASKGFYIPACGTKFAAKLWKYSESHMAICVWFVKRPSADSPPFLHLRKYVLVDQREGHEGNQDLVWMDQPRFGPYTAGDMQHDYLSSNIHFPITCLTDSEHYMQNDAIIIRIILEPIAKMFKRVSSMDGTLLLRIDNYTERKREQVDGIREFLTSESFYTSDKGLRMDVEINLNGRGPKQGKGISILPMFRIGEWDDSHSIPIKYKYERLLMDQSDAPTKRNILHESGVQEYKHFRDSYKFEDFMTHEDVEKFPYLKDDSLLIQIVVEIVS